MGVRGLTALVDQLQNSISKTHTLPVSLSSGSGNAANHDVPNQQQSHDTAPKRCMVVDFWAFIFWTFDLLDRRLGKPTWILGGCYREHEALVRDIVNLWLQVCANIWPIFVVDGPTPFVKHDTVARRLQERTAKVVEFMRSSPNSQSRNSYHFQKACRTLPPFTYASVLSAIKSFDPVFFPLNLTPDFISSLDRSKPALRFVAREADFDVASLAMMFNGIVLSQDSDFFILCAQGKTCGYASFDGLSFGLAPPAPDREAGAEAGDSFDGFTVSSSSKKKQKKMPEPVSSTESSPYPPEDIDSVEAIRVTAYSCTALATQLGIPPNLLAFLATLRGNDHVDYSSYFFRGSLNNLDSSAKLYHIARILKDCYSRFTAQTRAASAKATMSGFSTPSTNGTVTPTGTATPGKVSKPTVNTERIMHELLDPARSLMNRIVDKLLVHSGVDWLSSQEVTEMVDQLLQAMSVYTHAAQDSMLSPEERELGRFIKGHYAGLVEQGNDPGLPLSPERSEALDSYRLAYLTGDFPATLINAMLYRRIWSFSLLEDVSQSSVSQAYAQPIRFWTYAVLFSAFGLEWASTDEDKVREEEERRRQAEAAQEREDWLDEVVSVASESTGSEAGSSISAGDTDPTGYVEASYLPLANKKPDAVVIETLRRGDRAGEMSVPILAVSDLLAASQSSITVAQSPISLLPEAERTAIFLTAHLSYSDELAQLDPTYQTAVSVLRHVVRITALKSASRTTWWKQHDVRGALLMVLLLSSEGQDDLISRLISEAPAMPSNQSIHNAAVFQGPLEASAHLRQALGLPPVLPQRLFHGALWHTLMDPTHHAAVAQAVDSDHLNRLFELVAGTEGYVYAGPSREERKARKRQEKEESAKGGGDVQSRFNVLELA